jgi:hypothetical protein
MRWNEIDERLRKLYNAVATAHGEGSSFNSAQKAEQEAYEIMEELTKVLQDK